MAGKTVAVYDCSESYISQFLKYANSNPESGMELLGFTKLEDLDQFLKGCPVDLLLFSMEELVEEEENLEEKYDHFIGHNQVKEFVYLGERRNSKSRMKHIDKYQSTKTILHQIREILYPKEEEAEIALLPEETELYRITLVGVYDPAQNAQSVYSALEVAEDFSLQTETIFIDFDRFSLLEAEIGRELRGTVSDLLYFYQTFPLKMKEVLREKCIRYHNLDYLPGPEDFEDKEILSEKEWPEFFRTLAVCGGYETVVVYMGEAFSNLESFFDHCTQVFVPAGSDDLSVQKMYLFAKHLYGKGRRDLYEKVQNLYVQNAPQSSRLSVAQGN